MSKKQQVTEYLNNNPDLTRSQAIPKLMELFDMSKAGASTYFYNYHNENKSVVISKQNKPKKLINIIPIVSNKPMKIGKDNQGRYTKILES